VVVVVWRKSSMHDLSRWLCGPLSPFDNRHDHAAQGYQPRGSFSTAYTTTMDGNNSYGSYGYSQAGPSYPQAGPSSSAEVNPYHLPYKGPVYSTPSAHNAPVPANAYEYDVGIVAQQSVYVPGAAIDKRGGAGGKLARGGKRTTVLRKGAGKVWEDQTLLEWNPCA
jgi:hypothetical protein